MALLGAGGILFAVGLSISVYGVARSVVPARRPTATRAEQNVAWTMAGAATAPAWTGFVTIVTLVAAMYGMTIVAFELMQALPVVASGASGH
jgi:hypothetical protein